MTQSIIKEPSSGLQTKSHQGIYIALLIAWFCFLCFVPNLRLLRAPDWCTELVHRFVGIGESGARAFASVALQSTGLILLGGLVALSRCAQPMRSAAFVSILGAPVLGLISLWINYGHFPLPATCVVAALCSIFGALIGLSFRKSRVAVLATLVFAGGVFSWGTSTGISDDLYHLTVLTGDHIVRHADTVTKDDDPVGAIMRLAFEFASDNSLSNDPVFENQAAILAMGVILGEERVASVAKRPLKVESNAQFDRIRQKMTFHGRHDLVRHFWVSAGLTVLSGEESSISVGIAKELMDAEPGGSGFSFVDLMADQCGIRIATAATRDAETARAFQQQLNDGLAGEDLLPSIEGLPEGLPLEVFEQQYGGVRGEETERVVQEIQQRIDSLEVLQ